MFVKPLPKSNDCWASLQDFTLRIIEVSPPSLQAVGSIVDRTLSPCCVYETGLAPADGPGPSAKYTVILQVEQDTFNFRAMEYWNWLSSDGPSMDEKDAQTVQVYYSDDGTTWDSTDVGDKFKITGTMNNQAMQSFLFLRPINAKYWKFEFIKTTYLDKPLTITEIDFAISVSLLVVAWMTLLHNAHAKPQPRTG